MYPDVVPMTTELYAFRDNVAHSNHVHGVRTYSPGCGNIEVSDSTFADNYIGVESHGPQAYKTYVKSSVIIGLSNDSRSRFATSTYCRPIGVDYSYNERPCGQINLENVSFKGFHGQDCDGMVFRAHKMNGQTQKHASGVVLAKGLSVDSPLVHPDFPCTLTNITDGPSPIYLYLEDFDGALKPNRDVFATSTGGFYVQNSLHATAFISSYCSSTGKANSCALYCPGVCLRMIYIYPKDDTHDIVKLTVSDGTTTHTYDKSPFTDPNFHDNDYFGFLLPWGTYSAHFIDSAGELVYAHSAVVSMQEAPNCNSHVTDSSIRLATRAPTHLPTVAPFAFTSGCINGDGTFSQGTLSGFSNNDGSSVFSIIDDGTGNKIMRRTGRNRYSQDLKIALRPDCFQTGSKYRLHIKHMPLGKGSGDEDGSTALGMLIWKKPDNSMGYMHVLW
eukprot:15366923-Ditylum_brightwellii.AAC.2